MQENTNKDPAIRLFGKKIALPTDVDSPANSSGENSPSSSRLHEDIIEKGCSIENATDGTQDVDAPATNSEEGADTETASESNVNPQTPAINEESAKSKASESEKEQNDPKSSQEKSPIKKPDKILPCPRCNSMDTKFCYYNNYNVNQPRHFCKACQRYWTAGGTMRNVPVGAGRRKTKSSASHYHHLSISEALQAARIDAPNGTQHPMLKSNGRVLSFGLDAPICDSMATVLNLADKRVLNGTQNGVHTLNERRVPCKGGENGDDCSSGSSVTVSNSKEGSTTHPENTHMYRVNGFASPIPCLPGVPWPPYPWNSALAAPLPPAFCPPGYPLSFYPAPYWNCGVPGPWNIPMLSPQSPASVNQKATCSSPTSPTLGKHARDSDTVTRDDMEKEEPPKQKNGCVLVPKTLRIDDPSEAAKSSIWATLGIKNESIGGGALLKGLQPKSDKKSNLSETSPVLRANPAALSRAIDFHERS